MTLVIGIANSEQTILMSDRRLTSNGTVVEDESNKTAIVLLPQARLVTGFTGLGQIGTIPNRFGPPPPGAFRTSWWLLDQVRKAAPPDYMAEPTVRRFSTLATEEFRGLPGRPSAKDRLLAVMFVGYDYSTHKNGPFLRNVFNFGRRTMVARDEFIVDDSPPDRAFMVAIGAFGVLDLPAVKPSADRLRELAELGHPPSALVGKGVEVIRLAASQPESANTIGSNIMSVVVPADPTEPVRAEYHPDHASSAIFSPDLIDLRTPDRGGLLLGGFQFKSGPPNGPPGHSIVVPRVGRNAPCPCGSGKKYKRCHGR